MKTAEYSEGEWRTQGAERFGLPGAGAAPLGIVPSFGALPRECRPVDQAIVERDRLSQILDGLTDAILVLDAKGRMLHANAAARKTLTDHRFGLTALLDVSRPRAKSRCASGRVRGTDGCGDGAMVLETKDGRRHICHATPMRTGPAPKGQEPLQLVVIRTADKTAAATRLAQSLFGLTDREREVLFNLVEVGGIPDVAAALDISLGTARSHVKALFGKTGTSRQCDLVRLVWEVASPFATASAMPVSG